MLFMGITIRDGAIREQVKGPCCFSLFWGILERTGLGANAQIQLCMRLPLSIFAGHFDAE